jgi:D-alanyl-lipoteichoic acid acyltransferase DltB (MBOAT superfamily)
LLDRQKQWDMGDALILEFCGKNNWWGLGLEFLMRDIYMYVYITVYRRRKWEKKIKRFLLMIVY